MSPIEKRVSELVKNSDISHSEIARRIGVSRSAVGRWERDGKISIDNLVKLCSILSVEVQYVLLGGASENILSLQLKQLKILNIVFTVTDIAKLDQILKMLNDN